MTASSCDSHGVTTRCSPSPTLETLLQEVVHGLLFLSTLILAFGSEPPPVLRMRKLGRWLLYDFFHSNEPTQGW